MNTIKKQCFFSTTELEKMLDSGPNIAGTNKQKMVLDNLCS